MNTKKWLYPLVLSVSALMIVISVFLNFYITNKGLGWMEYNLGIFTSYDAQTFLNCHTIWGIFTLLGFIFGAIGVIACLVLTILELFNFKHKFFNYSLLNTIFFYIALAGTAIMVICGILFSVLNIGDDGLHRVTLTTGYFVASAGLIIGTLTAFLSMEDLEYEKAKSLAEKKDAEVAEENAKKEEAKKEVKPAAKTTVKKETKPVAKKPAKTEAKKPAPKAAAKPAVKAEPKKTAAKPEAKKVATKPASKPTAKPAAKPASKTAAKAPAKKTTKK